MSTSFDLSHALRRLKPHKHVRLYRRGDRDLTFAENENSVAAPLLLDTCVYLHAARGETPEAVDQLLESRTLHHSTVALAELTFRLGARLPANHRERAARHAVEAIVERISTHRLANPGTAVWGEAGILAGIRARAGGHPMSPRGLNDALIFLQARTLGAAVLTANVADFDILQQIVPSGRVVFYRAV